MRWISQAAIGLFTAALFTGSVLAAAQQPPPAKPPVTPNQTGTTPAPTVAPGKSSGAKPSGPGKPEKGDGGAAAKLMENLNDQPEYTVGVGDNLGINVWKEPEVSGPVAIRGDCRITLPLIKEVEVCGMTPTQIQALLTEKLSKFIAAPDVTVTLTGMQSRKVFFVGNFKRQGGMVLNGPMTIAQALSDAGGLSDFANGKKVIIRRPQKNGPPKEFVFNYNDYLKGKATTENILLMPNDTIIVK